MNNLRFPHDICVTPHCDRWRWAARGIRICGPCAMEILKALREEAQAFVQNQHDAAFKERIAQLEYLAQTQERRIASLTEEKKPARSNAPTTGVVYYLRVGGYIKIGWTSNLEKRMRAYAPDTVLLATEPGTRKDEQRRHKQFSAHRTHGREWYALAPALTQHIDRVVKEHGRPEQVSFAAQPVTIPQPRPKQYVGGNYRGLGLVGNERITI